MSSSDPSLLSDICEVNLSYLLIAQRLLRENFASGMFRLGVGHEVAQALQGLSPARVVRLASSSSLLCCLRLDEAHMVNAMRQDSLGETLQQAHATILLAGQPVQSWN